MNEEKSSKVKLVKHEWPDERRKRHKRYLKTAGWCALSIILFFSGLFIGVGVAPEEKNTLDYKLNAVYRIMKEDWFFGNEIDDLKERLLDSAIYGMTTQEKDPFTAYMDSNVANQFMSSMEGNIVGIGVQYSTATDDYIILKVFKGSAADEAGIQAGDIIRKVDGVAVSEIEDITNAVTGKEGSKVVITVQRGSEMMDVTCVRKNFDSSVNGYIQDGIGVLEIMTIAENTALKVGEVLDYFKSNDVERIIIDLRDNGGGYLTSVVDIASYFLPQGSVVLNEKDKDGNVSSDKTNPKITPYNFEKIVVMIDGGSASAAEVLAIALKETIDVTLVGDTSYGKGTIQTTMPFTDGSMLKYTKAIWLSPKGNWVNKVGIKPDVEVLTDKALLTGKPKEFDPVGIDSVSPACQSMQIYLDYLGYSVGRSDGYFSAQTLSAMKQFINDYGLKNQNQLDEDLLTVIFSKVIYESRINEKMDHQKIKAMEVVRH